MMRTRSSGICLLLAALFLSASPLSAFLGAAAEEGGAVTIHVRTVRAASGAGAGGLMELDSRLEDLRSKLQRLGFGSFRLLSTEARRVDIEHRETISLGDGTTLTVRPLYAKDSRVGMWLKWQDSAGDSLLDTRMHFAQGESMIAGVDQTGNTGILLAIDVNSAN